MFFYCIRHNKNHRFTEIYLMSISLYCKNSYVVKYNRN